MNCPRCRHENPPEAKFCLEFGMRPLVAHCRFGLGKLHAKTGQREEAKQHLATPTTLYREMDMRFWLEQAQTETALG